MSEPLTWHRGIHGDRLFANGGYCEITDVSADRITVKSDPSKADSRRITYMLPEGSPAPTDDLVGRLIKVETKVTLMSRESCVCPSCKTLWYNGVAPRAAYVCPVCDPL